MRAQRRWSVSLVLGMALVALSWGFHWPINKFALTEIPPLTYRAAGVLFAGVVLLAIARLNGSKLVIPKGERVRVTICAMFNIAGFHGTFPTCRIPNSNSRCNRFRLFNHFV